MAEVTVSVVMERMRALMEEHLNGEVNLLKKVVQGICDMLKSIRNVVYDAERRSLKDEAVEHWVSWLERTCHKLEDVLDQLDVALLKPNLKQVTRYSSCLFSTRFEVSRYLAKNIRHVTQQLVLISEEMINRYDFAVTEPTAVPTPGEDLSDEEVVYGRDNDREILVDKLVGSSGGLHVLALVGEAGIGKTTLAQLVYNDSRVEACFELRIWINFSDPFDVVGIAKQIIESTGNIITTNHFDSLLQQLRDSISGKKILLVLDDVSRIWPRSRSEDYDRWEHLERSLRYDAASGSIILVTSRDESMGMGTMEDFNVGPLSEKDCWLLLHHTVEGSPIIFEDMLKEIAKKCKGLPFAAKTVRSVLRFKTTPEEWKSLLDDEEIWEFNSADDLPNKLLIHDELFPMLKHCFSYCSIFPQDSWIEVEKLIEIWIALGYLGSGADRGREYFNTLAMYPLFRCVKKNLDGQIKRCMMNHRVHDFALYLRKRRRVDIEQPTTCRVCSPISASQVHVYQSLFWDNDSPLTICNCLRRVRVLRMRSKSSSIPQGVETLISLRWLELSGKKLSVEDAKAICKLYKLQFLRFYVQEIPREIENFAHLTLLDLSFNDSLEELPESICSLLELRTLNIKFCRKLSKLPKGIDKLKKLEHLPNLGTSSLKQLPEGISRMTQLRTLNEYCGGVGWSELRWLEGLNQLSGFICLKIRLADGDYLEKMSRDAWEAHLWHKKHIEELQIIFEDEIDEHHEVISDARWEILAYLIAHEKLQKLTIWFFKGGRFTGGIKHYSQALKSIKLYSCGYLLEFLPQLWKLPCLEEIYLSEMHGLQSVKLQFASLSVYGVAFPKLKVLAFNHCTMWKEWEDISEEDEASEVVSIMPCLKKLTIAGCPLLEALPHRLLHKLPSTVELNIICCSTNVQDQAAAFNRRKSTSPHNIASTSQLLPAS